METLNKHEAARFKICQWCCNKVRKGRVAYRNAGQVPDHYVKSFESIDDTDVYCPLLLYVTCKLYLAKASKGSSPTPPSRFPWPIIRCTRLNACSFLLKTGDTRMPV